jgi:hypothetical protein
MTGTAQTLLLLISIFVASASAGQVILRQGSLTAPVSAQLIKLGISVGNSYDAEQVRPEGNDLGRNLGSGLALANGDLYRAGMQKPEGE